MNRTFLLILILIISAAGLVALSLNTKTTPPVTLPVSMAQTTLIMNTPVASTSGVLSSSIVINTNGNSVSAVQIELSYNPSDISNVDIKPGPFIKNPAELFKKIDADKGRVSYGLGIGLKEKEAKGAGVVAMLSFTKLRTSGTTSIAFLPKSVVTSLGISQSVLRSATGLTFDLSK